MAPHFLLMYAPAVVLFIFIIQQLMLPGFIFAKSFQAEKGSLQFKGIYVAFIFYAILSTSSFCHCVPP